MRCDDCGQLTEELTIPTVAHTEGEWTTETEPHCAYEGKRNLSCGVCGDCYRDRYMQATSASAGLAYVVNPDKKTCTITGIGQCTDLDICIPGEIGKYTVTAIGEKAFAETAITGLTVLEGVLPLKEMLFINAQN